MSTEAVDRFPEWTTVDLIAAQRARPVESVAVELERRGIVLRHWGLERGNAS